MIGNYPTSIKFCFEVEPFNTNDYIFHAHSSNQIQRIEMTGDSTNNDVALFVGSFLAFSNSCFGSQFIDSLFKEEELALVGGLLFEQNDLKISASCCADFQDWIIVVEDIKRKVSPWMGHDPDPWFEFEGDKIILWSDEVEREDIYSIQLTQQEFEQQLNIAKQELQFFIDKIELFALKNYKDDYRELVQRIKQYLFVEHKQTHNIN